MADAVQDPEEYVTVGKFMRAGRRTDGEGVAGVGGN